MDLVYVDESGSDSLQTALVMCGLVVEDRDMVKTADEFGAMLARVSPQGPYDTDELKTHKLMAGVGKWKKVTLEIRKRILRNICRLAVSDGKKIVGIAVSYERLKMETEKEDSGGLLCHAWTSSGMFLCSLLRYRHRGVKENAKYKIVLFDNHNWISRLNKMLQEKSPWYEGLNDTIEVNGEGKKINDYIIGNRVISLESRNSAHIQIADAVSFVYRRYLELRNKDAVERWDNERDYYEELFNMLEQNRIKIGKKLNTDCYNFYESIRHLGLEL